MKDYSSPKERVLEADWWWKPALLSSSLAVVVFVHWLILR